jgi:hypothetical protein
LLDGRLSFAKPTLGEGKRPPLEGGRLALRRYGLRRGEARCDPSGIATATVPLLTFFFRAWASLRRGHRMDAYRHDASLQPPSHNHPA